MSETRQEGGGCMTKDDEQARRLASLIVAFSNARGPLAGSELHRRYYGSLVKDSFDTAFKRDRRRLGALGLVLRPVSLGGGQAGWRADPDESFAGEQGLSDEEALLVDLVCQPLLDDPEFALRHELARALEKVDRRYMGGAVRRRTARDDGGLTAGLLRALSERRPVEALYQDARGETSRRSLALLGAFGLHGCIYVVAQDSAELAAGAPWRERARTFRADRFLELRAGGDAGAYEIPADFVVNAFCKLPFQMGPRRAQARVVVPPSCDQDARGQLEAGAGRRDGRREEGEVWLVDVADLRGAARWLIGAGMTPLDPPSLLEAYRAVLREALA
ncbi:helix-turn-helix transcriptional regulator [Olsenella massiliensis]|uniref:helix-turn-helix transcriptional regulator n=1 Tax=Olsenella massiliensis TaxID=1622075 RepID=UPI00071CFB94|nr:WYL domain-containing protein [Olsenella massiliensis]